MSKTAIIVIFGTAVTLVLFLAIYSSWKNAVKKDDTRLIKQADSWIEKIENYRKTHYKAPDSLEVVGIKTPDDGPLLYAPDRDSVNYMIHFQIGFFISKSYSSINKYWQITD